MMRSSFSLLCLVALAAGCKKDATFEEPLEPGAAITWLNAISDTGQLDLRVIDITTNAGFFDADFRAVDMFPERIQAGPRHIRVFMSSTDINIASTVLLDTTFTFVADQRYNFLVHGFGRSGQTPAKQALITTASPPAVTAGQVHVRVINLAPSLDPDPTTPVDGWVVARGSAALAGSPTVEAGDAAYASVPVGSYRMAFTAAGTTSPVLFQANLPAGVVDTMGNIAGTLIEGTAITAIVVPRSVPLSQARFSFSAILPFASLTSTPDSTATVVTPAAHGLASGDTLVVAGADSAVYNGTFVVTVVNPTTFTYRLSRATTGSPATGYPFGFPPRFASAFNGRPISRLTSSGTTATLVSRGSHSLVKNDIFTITGANEAAYNGSFAVDSMVNSTTIRYTTNGTPSATPATGSPIFRAGDADFTRPNVVFLIDRRP